MHELRRVAGAGVDDIKHARANLRWRLSIFSKVGESRTDRKTEHFDSFGAYPSIAHDSCALFVRDQEIICRRAIPNRVDRNRVGDDGDVFAAALGSQNLLQQIRIRRKGRDDYLRLKTVEQAAEILLEAVESLESFVEIFFAIEPVVNVAPRFRPAVDESEIGAPDNLVKCAERFREQIAEFDFNFWRDPRQAGANASGRAVVSLTKSGGEDQNSFHDTVSIFPPAMRRKFNGYFRSAK